MADLVNFDESNRVTAPTKQILKIENEIPRQNKKNYTNLIEINLTTGLPTGRRKINDPSDPDYIPPIQL